MRGKKKRGRPRWVVPFNGATEEGVQGGRPHGGGRRTERGGGLAQRWAVGTGPWPMGTGRRRAHTAPSSGDGSLTHGPGVTVTGGAV
jgi:hypothetical protein